MKQTESKKTDGADKINREGARRYDEGARANARSGASDEQAHAAARALDTPEGDKLREAEKEGKAAAHRRP